MADKAPPYDPKNKDSIEAYAKRLLGHSLRDLVNPSDLREEYRGRGAFGQLVELAYFKYKPNSVSEPDFKEAGVELKTNPIKKTKKGYASKERLVFNIIDFMKEHACDFEESSFWKKNKLILLLMYLYEKDKNKLDYIFKFITLYPFPNEDVKIIRNDWQKIVDKIKAGKAHELSEGDTLYLGACTKGANRRTLRQQPFSNKMAMQRAYSLKSKYLNFIIAGTSLNKEFKPIIKDASVLEHETLEEYVIRQFSPYYGKAEFELFKHFGVKTSKAKHKFHLLCMAILGIKGAKAAEFEKADIVVKTIRLEESGTIEQSMSFGQIKFEEVVNEEWEDSYWHDTVTKRFFFVIFQKDGEGQLRLKKTMFWTMPHKDVLAAKKFWRDIKAKIMADRYDDFYALADNKIFHVRPKARNRKDKMRTPTGRLEKKKAYWLNSSYIKRIITE